MRQRTIKGRSKTWKSDKKGNHSNEKARVGKIWRRGSTDGSSGKKKHNDSHYLDNNREVRDETRIREVTRAEMHQSKVTEQ